MATATPAIEAHAISRSFPLDGRPLRVLDDVSFAIPRGGWATLAGPSGSGKSTLLGIIAGLDTPTSGQIILDGIDVTTLGESRLARIRNEKVGMVFQGFNLIPTLTAQENVEVPIYASRDRRRSAQRARDMLERVGLGDRLGHRPSQLSGGQQQRVAIARALVNRPALLVADEPTGNLDSATGAEILDLFAELRDETGVTIVVATHDPAVAAQADQTLRLVDGRLAGEPAGAPAA